MGEEEEGGGTAIDDEPPLVQQESMIDEALLQRSLLEITSENAKTDIIEEAIFGLEFLREIAGTVAIAPLTSNIAHDLSIEQLSSNFSSYQCIFELVDNDASGDISDGDRLAIEFNDCPEAQLLSGVLNGRVDVHIISLTYDSEEFVFEVEVNLNELSYAADSETTIDLEGKLLVSSSNSAVDRNTDLYSEISTETDGAIQFSVGENALIFVDPFMRRYSFLDIRRSDISMGVGQVSDSTLDGNYNCPVSTVSFAEFHQFPSDGVLMQCEGDDSFARLEVYLFGYELANLVVNDISTLYEWSEFGSYALAEAFSEL